MSEDRPVLVVRRGRAGHVTLNRPKTLNALDIDMIDQIERALLGWQDDPTVHLVAIDAVPGKAFCAGGDVRTLRHWAETGQVADVERFFTREYAVNRVLARYPKPVVSLIDGLWMGGGVGLSVHGAVRVVTERAVFAMPEAQIGLFPDVGATYVLPRLRGAFGLFLGLTGARVGAGDACRLGLATHFVPSAALPALATALAEHGIGALADHAVPPPDGTWLPLQPEIDSIFAPHADVAQIAAALEAVAAPWAQEALRALRSASPTALRWTLDLLRAGAARTFEQCQAAELEAVLRAVAFPDFAEGVRAAVIDKDRLPRWA